MPHKTMRAHHEFGEAVWYKINTQKSLAFYILYTNKERSEKTIQ